MGAEFLSPENGSATETAADIQYIATQARRAVPHLRCVLEGALLCGNQLAAQLLARRTNGGWLVDQSRVVMDARPRPVPFQDLPGLTLIHFDEPMP